MKFQSYLLIIYSSNDVIRQDNVKAKVTSFTLDGHIYFNVGFYTSPAFTFPQLKSDTAGWTGAIQAKINTQENNNNTH